MGKRKNVVSLALAALLLSLLILPALADGASEEPSRVINVVYDDSGSMIKGKDQLVDTWCQAKYAMEVFSAMLGSKDTMNIYVMSDFENGRISDPRISLSGADGQSANVAKVHEMLTPAGNTPFNTVRKAYSDLAAAGADEKWLVILTDGEFQGVGDINAFFAEKDPSVKVMFLGMGQDAAAIQENQDAGVFFESAATSDQILSKITGICTRIFNRNRLQVDAASQTVSFDVPMSELVVFAQGENVNIEGIADSSGKKYKMSADQVTVQYSEQAATNYSDAVVDRNLKGSIATFDGDYSAGSYTINVTGADTVEVYYKPNVAIAAYLYDGEGNEVTDLANLKAGEYSIGFGMVKAGTGEKIEQSKLLGNVAYQATVTNNGSVLGDKLASGDRINIGEGDLEIDVTAHYLEYNSVSTHLKYLIYEDKKIDFSETSAPQYAVTKSGLDDSQPIEITATINGAAPTDEQWAQMKTPKVTSGKSAGGSLNDMRIEKSTTPGVYNIYPKLYSVSMGYNLYGDTPYTVSYSDKVGDSVWSGEMQGTVKISDNRSLLDRVISLAMKIGKFVLLFIFILGYLPPVKKYLPKSIKRSPTINCEPNRPGIHPRKSHGKYDKSVFYTICPYAPERAVIKYSPSGVPAPRMRVKAAGHGTMLLMNIKDFAAKPSITINGMPVDKDAKKPMLISAGVMMSVNTKEVKYTCVPSA